MAKGDVELGGYIQKVAKNVPVLSEYDYVHGNAVVRVSHFLTPAEAREYDAAGDEL